MSNRYPGNIEIGGRIPLCMTYELAEAIYLNGGQLSWAKAAAEIKKAIAKAAKDKTTLKIFNDKAENGCFAETEALIGNWPKACFRRHSDAWMEYSSEIVVYWPEKFASKVVVPSDQSGNVFFNATILKALAAEGMNLQQAIMYLEVAEMDFQIPPLEIV